MDGGWEFFRIGAFLALGILLGEVCSAAEVAAGPVKWIRWLGKVWRVMIWVVMLRHVLEYWRD